MSAFPTWGERERRQELNRFVIWYGIAPSPTDHVSQSRIPSDHLPHYCTLPRDQLLSRLLQLYGPLHPVPTLQSPPAA